MSFSFFYTPTRKEYKCKTVKSNNKEKIRIPILDKKNNEEKSVFIPKYFIFDITFLKKENYLVLSKDGKIEVYITPLICTILNNMKFLVNSNESLSRQINERIDANARRLIRKSVEKSKITVINNKQYVRLETEIKRTEKDNHFAILNLKRGE